MSKNTFEILLAIMMIAVGIIIGGFGQMYFGYPGGVVGLFLGLFVGYQAAKNIDREYGSKYKYKQVNQQTKINNESQDEKE